MAEKGKGGKSGGGKRKLTGKQLRFLFARKVLTGKGSGKKRKVVYDKGRSKSLSGQRKRGVDVTKKYRNTPSGSTRPVIGGSKAAGLRSGAGSGGASKPSRAERIAAGKAQGRAWQGTPAGQAALIGIGAQRRATGGSVKDAARAYNASKRSGDYSATRAARVAVGKERAQDFIAKNASASRLGNYNMSTQLLKMPRREAARLSGIDKLGGKGKRGQQAGRDAARAADTARNERGARVEAGRKVFANFATRKDLGARQRAGVALGAQKFRGGAAMIPGKPLSVSDYRAQAKGFKAARVQNNADPAVVAGRSGRYSRNLPEVTRVAAALRAEGTSSGAANSRAYRLIKQQALGGKPSPTPKPRPDYSSTRAARVAAGKSQALRFLDRSPNSVRAKSKTRLQQFGQERYDRIQKGRDVLRRQGITPKGMALENASRTGDYVGRSTLPGPRASGIAALRTRAADGRTARRDFDATGKLPKSVPRLSALSNSLHKTGHPESLRVANASVDRYLRVAAGRRVRETTTGAKADKINADFARAGSLSAFKVERRAAGAALRAAAKRAKKKKAA